MKHPFIFSFPRSGLHLTAKIIGWPLHVNFDGMDNSEYLIQQVDKKSKEVLFTHQAYDMLDKKSLDYIISSCVPIFILRDPKDALLSWFFMNDTSYSNTDHKEISRRIRGFAWSPFLGYSNRIILWKKQISGYKQYHHNALVIRYENLVHHYDIESQKISEYLNIDVLPSLPSLKSVELSRKGVVGDYALYFDGRLLDEINDICKEEIEYINQFLI